MTATPPPFFDIFQSYFQSTENPNLAHFVETQEQTIIAYHQKGQNLALIWSTRYGKAQSFYYRNILKRALPKGNSKPVDFGKVAIKILLSEAPADKEANVTPASAFGSKSPKSNKSATPVSSVFLDKFRSTYENMIDEKKWTLKSGKIVENEIFLHGLQSEFENLSHSFIIDPSDPVWKKKLMGVVEKLLCLSLKKIN